MARVVVESVAVAVGAAVLYLATMAHVHGGDTPFLVRDVVRREWFVPAHPIARVIGGVAVTIGDVIAPGTSPYGPLIVACALASAACAGALYAITRAIADDRAVALGSAALWVVCLWPWRLGTTFELHPLALAPLLVGFAVLGTGEPGARRIVAAGALQGLAVATHLVVAPGPIVAMLLLRGRARWVFVAAVSLTFILGAGTSAAVQLPLGDLPALVFGMRAAGQFVPSAVPRAFRDTISPGIGGTIVALALVAAGIAAVYRGRGRVEATWAAFVLLTVVVAIRVEAWNEEYYIGVIAGCLALVASLSRGAPRVTAAALLAAAAAIFVPNFADVSGRRVSPTGEHVSSVRDPDGTIRWVDVPAAEPKRRRPRGSRR